MKRRLFLRTLTGAMSAAIFTASGWLMGTRTLTMNCPCDVLGVNTFTYCYYGPAPVGCHAPSTYQGNGVRCVNEYCSESNSTKCGEFCWDDASVNCTKVCPP